MKRQIHRSYGAVVCVLVFMLACGTGAGILRAQLQTPPGTIRVQVVLVPVNVVVTDKNGNPVLDLKKSDFEIRENGVPQEIKHFSLQTLSEIQPPPEDKLQLRRVPTMDLEPQTGRTFLILLGRGKIQTPFKGMDRVIEFVRNDLLPQDQVAVMAYNRATRFTTDHALVIQALERYKKSAGLIEEELKLMQSGLAAIYGSKEIPKSLQPKIDAIFGGLSGLAARQIPPGHITNSGQVSKDFQRTADIMQRNSNESLTPSTVSPLENLEAQAVSDLPFDDYLKQSAMTFQDLQNMFTAVEYLRYVEGEKHLLLVTPNGLFLPRAEDENNIASMANDARVSIDTIQTSGVHMADLFGPPPPLVANMQTGGLIAPPSKPPVEPAAYTFSVEGLRNLAQLTGGQAFIYQDLSKAFSAINQATRSEYLLGYYPTDTNWNGRYRHITVTVKRPGVHVYFRHGYYGNQSLVPYNREAFLSYSRIAAAGAYVSEIKDLPFKANAAGAVDSHLNSSVSVSLWIDPKAVTFQPVNGRYQGKVYITLFYGDSRGKYLGDYWDTLEMELKPATYARVMKEGIPYTVHIPMEAPKESLKVVLYDYGSDRVGSLMTKVR